ncbi:cytochrome P450 [Pseudofrankia sp. BMG5.37]|uniref:cytochrome P450 n=1 Tax=Pseudofrankia sp. BMG5.37 TaxID=3050035 RepID=UPI002895BA38|nr:cytochrome P450 [Pseudofrankia sp. BMG5.37]MDT3439047.1 cytochrome P450 [Pseudofrankia sp. BMG5.37]
MTSAPAAENPLAAFAPEHRADPYPVYRRIHAGGALQPLAPSVWLAPRYDECAAVLHEPAWGHGYDAGINPFRPGVPAADVPGSFLVLDPPDHTRLRAVVGRGYTPRAVERLRAGVRATAERLVADMVGAGEAEVMAALADPLPLYTIATMLGIPTSLAEELRGPLRAMSRGVDPDVFLSPADVAARATSERVLEDALGALLDQRRRAPTDDLLGAIAAAASPDGPISHELRALAALMIIGGYGTSESMLGNAVLALARDPDQLDLLRHRPELAASAVEELIRFDPPVQFTHRVALRDLTVGGQLFPRGSGIVVILASANRDPAVFTDPDRLDLTRYHGPLPARRHLAFSLGVHFCIGALVGRVQIEAALTALAAATRSVELAEPPVYRPNVAIRTLDTLRVRLERP